MVFIYHTSFIHCLLSIRLDCFQFLAVLNSMSRIFLYKYFCWQLFSILLGIYPGTDLLYHRVGWHLVAFAVSNPEGWNNVSFWDKKQVCLLLFIKAVDSPSLGFLSCYTNPLHAQLLPASFYAILMGLGA